REPARGGDGLVKAAAVAEQPSAGGRDEGDAARGCARIDDLDLRAVDLLRSGLRDRVCDRRLVDHRDHEDRLESFGDERSIDLDAFAERWRRGGGRLLRRRELVVVLGGRHVDAGCEIFVAEEHVYRQRPEAELALHLIGHRGAAVDDDDRPIAHASTRTSPTTTCSEATSSAPSSAISRAMPRTAGRPSRVTSTSRPSSVERLRQSSSAAWRSAGPATRSSSRVRATNSERRSAVWPAKASDVAVVR